jgi:RQC domain
MIMYRHPGRRPHGQGRAGAQGAPTLCHARWHQLSRHHRTRYFGETAVEACGQCDLCLNPSEATDVTEAAQRALSAVHRLGGRFGRGRIVDHLLVRPRMPGLGDAMSTFGIGRGFSGAGWRDLLLPSTPLVIRTMSAAIQLLGRPCPENRPWTMTYSPSARISPGSYFSVAGALLIRWNQQAIAFRLDVCAVLVVFVEPEVGRRIVVALVEQRVECFSARVPCSAPVWFSSSEPPDG